MKQTKIQSLVESIINILIGGFVAFISQLIVFPMFGIEATLSDNLGIMAWFTLISVVRSYVIRRWFNNRLHNFSLVLSKNLKGES